MASSYRRIQPGVRSPARLAHLDALAAGGLYGAPVPVQAGGLDLEASCAVTEELASGPQDSIVTLILDATAQPGLAVTRQRLAAVNASVTVRLGFDGVLVPQERFAGQARFDPAEGLRPDRMRINGSLALGLVSRCTRLLGPGPLDDELAACRERLDEAITADATAMAEARAAASELAVRATAALAVRDGSRSVIVDQHAARLAREALFLLVFGSRPGIKSALLRRFGASSG